MANRANSPIVNNSGRARALADLKKRAAAGDPRAAEILRLLARPMGTRSSDALAGDRREYLGGTHAVAFLGERDDEE